MSVTTAPSSASPLPAAVVEPRVESAAGRRWAGALVAAAGAVLLTVATLLSPSGAGVGTHEQLSLPRCGWIVMMDLPCPTCGMTTAFAHAADGNLLASFRTQPLGAVLAVVTAMAVIMGCYVAVTGSRVGTTLGRYANRRSLYTLTAFVLIAWGWKVITYRGWV